MDPYCETCNSFLKLVSSCPRESVFDDGTSADKFAEVVWVFSSMFLYLAYAGLIIFAIFGRTSRVVILLFGLGIQQLFNDVVLKKSFAEVRPPGACSLSYGMPSGHSSFASFWATWLILEWVVFHEKVPFRKSKFDLPLRVLGILFSPLIPISRHFLNYHTVKQILYGLLDGAVLAILYFVVILALLYKDEGRFWGHKVSGFLKKIWFKDNLIGHETTILTNREEEAVQEQGHQENTQKEDAKIEIEPKTKHVLVLPLREGIQRLICKRKGKITSNTN